MDPNAQNPVNPAVPVADPNAGTQTPAPEPTMPTPPPAMPPEPEVPVTPEPAVTPEPQAPVTPTEGTGDTGTGMPPPAAI